MRQLILVFLLFLGSFFLISRFTELELIADTLRQGEWGWLLLAAGVQLAWILGVGALFGVLYQMLGLKEKTRRLVALAASANLLNVIAPSLGFGGMAVFLIDGRRRGLAPGRITAATALYLLYDYLSILAILSLGMVLLFQRGQLTSGEEFAAVLLLLVTMLLGLLLYLGRRSAHRLGKLLAGIARIGNFVTQRLLKRKVIEQPGAHGLAGDISAGLGEMQAQGLRLLLPLVLALVNKLVMFAVLLLVLKGFDQPVTLATLVVGVSIACLFAIISITPSGIGFVEGAMTLALHSMDLALAPAAVVTLAYRALTFWFPLSYGVLGLRWFSAAGGPAEAPTATPEQGTRLAGQGKQPPG